MAEYTLSNIPETISTADTLENTYILAGRLNAPARTITLRMPSGNSGTIKFNAKGLAADSSKSYAAGDVANIDVFDRFNAKKTASGDTFSIE